MFSTFLSQFATQTIIIKKAELFLIEMKENLPLWLQNNKAALCQACGVLFLRADAANKIDQFTTRLSKINEISEEEIKNAGKLLLRFKTEFAEQAKLNEEGVLKKVLQELTSHTEINAMKKRYFNFINSETKKKLNLSKKEEELLIFAEEFYTFISSLLVAHRPEELNLNIEQEFEDDYISNTRYLSQQDVLEILKLMPPNELSDESNILQLHQSFSFAFNFSEKELVETLRAITHKNDLIILGGINHTVYLSIKEEGYLFYDSNNPLTPKIYSTLEEIAERIKYACYTRFDYESAYMPIGFNIFRTDNVNPPRPTTLELIQTIEKGRDIITLNAKGAFNTTSLWVAAKYGCLDVVKHLITKNKVNVNVALGSPEVTPLAIAAAFGHIKVVKFLLENGADPNVYAKKSDGTNSTVPLTYAVQRGHLEVVRLLLDKGAHINGVTDEMPPLRWAVRKNHYHLAEYLIAMGASVNQTDADGETALNSAVQRKEFAPAFVELLLKNGAGINHVDKEGTTILYEATYNGNIDAVKLILIEINKLEPMRWSQETFAKLISEENIRQAVITIQKLNQLVLDIQDKPPLVVPPYSHTQALASLKTFAENAWKTSGHTFEFEQPYTNLVAAHTTLGQLGNLAIDFDDEIYRSAILNAYQTYAIDVTNKNIISDLKIKLEKIKQKQDTVLYLKDLLRYEADRIEIHSFLKQRGKEKADLIRRVCANVVKKMSVVIQDERVSFAEIKEIFLNMEADSENEKFGVLKLKQVLEIDVHPEILAGIGRLFSRKTHTNSYTNISNAPVYNKSDGYKKSS